jgi:hypothetical protein
MVPLGHESIRFYILYLLLLLLLLNIFCFILNYLSDFITGNITFPKPDKIFL